VMTMGDEMATTRGKAVSGRGRTSGTAVTA
jgi:hypothetical protein